MVQELSVLIDVFQFHSVYHHLRNVFSLNGTESCIIPPLITLGRARICRCKLVCMRACVCVCVCVCVCNTKREQNIAWR
jgi:hypothetical protein